MRIGIYLGDIKKPDSVGELTFELSFVEELLKQDTAHEFVFYYFGQKQEFKEQESVISGVKMCLYPHFGD